MSEANNKATVTRLVHEVLNNGRIDGRLKRNRAVATRYDCEDDQMPPGARV